MTLKEVTLSHFDVVNVGPGSKPVGGPSPVPSIAT